MNSTVIAISAEVENVTISELETNNNGGLDISPDVILKAEEECMKFHNITPFPSVTEGLFCPRTFDGWSCWNDTNAGSIATVNCPEFVPGFDPKREGLKMCMENGSWFKHPNTNAPWSNYTNCIDLSSLQMHQTVNKIYISGYTISLLFLAASFFIFCYFRTLQCKRISIHKNLFASFLMNNTLWLVWHLSVTDYPEVVNYNGIGCQILHVLTHYFLLSNYMWMFCEGLYLHTILVVAFVTENKILKWFYLLGWGAPVVLTIVYAAARKADSDASVYCWIDDTSYNYILSVPVVLSLVINLFFLINIVRVLLTKLRAANIPAEQDQNSTRKAVRATLILIPLLGLYYILIPFRPPPGNSWHFIFLVSSAVVSSFQGLAVSLLFCFFNGEVSSIFKKKYNQRQMMRRMTTTTYAGGHTSVTYMKNSMAEGVTLATTAGGSHNAGEKV